ncbi:MAG TPA: hypothetical protein VFW00_09935 [Rhodocyclaceae bacterium]|nr:hypothetical protein [Rhodocyclaceae bacterium]
MNNVNLSFDRHAWIGIVAAGMFLLIAKAPAGLQHWHIAAFIAAMALAAWIFNHRRYRSIADTPTSRIVSAAQGYTEITGIGRAIEGPLVYSPLNGLPCLWYRIEVESRDFGGKWHHDYTDVSDASFIIDDGSGRCVVDPEHANVITRQKDVVKETNRRSTQWLLIAGTRISAIGHFVSHSVAVDRPAISVEVRDKLADWKQTGAAKRFDLNKDGELSLQEWELARAAAKREVEKERSEASYVPDSHSLTKPPDGSPFIICDVDPEKLGRRYRLQAWGCLLLFFCALVGAAWLKVNLR